MVTLEQLNAALQACGGRTVPNEVFGTLLAPPNRDGRLDALVVAIGRGEEVAGKQLRRLITATSVARALHAVGFTVPDLETASRVWDKLGRNRLSELMARVKKGSQPARAELAALIHAPGQVSHLPVVQQSRVDRVLGEPQRFVDASGVSTATADQPPAILPLRNHRQAKVFGVKAALTLVADVTRAGDPTVLIEGAHAKSGGQRSYDWANKLRFQLTCSELTLVTALLIGMVGEVRFANHGSKWLTMTMQVSQGPYAGMVRVALGDAAEEAGRPFLVAIGAESLGEVAALCLHQCSRGLDVDESGMLAILGAVAKAYNMRAPETSHVRKFSLDGVGAGGGTAANDG